MSKKIVLKSVIAIAMLGFVLVFSSCKKEEKPKPTDSSVVAPTNLSVTDITETTVRLTWTGTADSYEILLANQSVADIPFSSTTNSCLVTNLTENTLYTWKIRAKKGNNYSEWVAGSGFTTAQKTPETHGIVGVWEYEKAEIKELTTSYPLMEEIIKTAFQEHGIPEMLGSSVFDGTYEFTEDGKVINSSNIASYEINDKKLTITNLGIISGTYDYSISGNEMYWDWNVDLPKILEEYEEFAQYKEYIAAAGITKFIIHITFKKQ